MYKNLMFCMPHYYVKNKHGIWLSYAYGYYSWQSECNGKLQTIVLGRKHLDTVLKNIEERNTYFNLDMQIYHRACLADYDLIRYEVEVGKNYLFFSDKENLYFNTLKMSDRDDYPSGEEKFINGLNYILDNKNI